MDELTQGDGELMELANQQLANGSAGRAPPATFSIEAMIDDAKSKEAGRSVYVDRDIIEIRIGRDTIRRQVTDADKRTYAAQYLAFKRAEAQEPMEGYPLSQWAAIPGKALIKEFAHYGIRSIEQLAVAPDSTIQMIGPYRGLKQQAQDWVANAEKMGPLIKLRNENEEMRNRLIALERMVSQQAEEIARARNAGGALMPVAAPPVDDGRIARLEAALAALAGAQAPPVGIPVEVAHANGVVLNKDGTPRKKSGPKPKVQEV